MRYATRSEALVALAVAAVLAANLSPAGAAQRRGGRHSTRPGIVVGRAATRRAHRAPALHTYRSPDGWHIDYPAGWKVIDMVGAPANRTLLYFTPDEDGIERIAVAVVPFGSGSSADLMTDVAMDAPSQYDVYRELGRGATTLGGMPAGWLSFRAAASGMPDLVRSYVLAVARDGHGYVVSFRTPLHAYDQRSPELTRVARTFAFAAPARPPARPRHAR